MVDESRTACAATEVEAAPRRRAADPVRASLVLSFTERYLGAMIQLVETAILARLLTPDDYGIYTVGIVFVGMTSILRDFGAVSFLFQEKDLSSSAVQTVHGTSLLISGVIVAVLLLLSGPIAGFYRAEGIRDVLRVLAITVLVAPYLSLIHISEPTRP